MKFTLPQKLALYLYNNFLGNFIGFIIAISSTRIVSHFFATKSFKNLWGLTTKKTLVDKQTFNLIEWTISIMIGFIVFEIISKGFRKKIDELLPSWKIMIKNLLFPSTNPINYAERNAAPAHVQSNRVLRDVQ